MSYTVTAGTGSGDKKYDTLDEAIAALNDVCYTQTSVEVVDDDTDKVVAGRTWYGCTDGIDECDDPISFGAFGYYGDVWIV